MRPIEEFEQQYAARSGVTVDLLREMGQRPAPCDCGEDGCEGFQMVSIDGPTCIACGHYDFHHDPGCFCGCWARTSLIL